MIKIDLLSVECLDKIHACLDLLLKDNRIEWRGSLRATYEDCLGIYNIERKSSKMWDMANNHEIESLFQLEQSSGIQGIALTHPRSVDELAVLNSVIRLMAPDKDTKRPLEMWAEYRKNINLWIEEMKRYNLTSEEINWLSNHPSITDGICESQEGLMALVQEPRLGSNSLNFADKCRKALAKKIGGLFDECEKEFFENIKKNNCSETLANYVWNVLLRVQRGYSFNRSHTLAYSLIALQEMNLAYKYPIIYWNCANLIVNSGSMENEEAEDGKNKSTDYAKMAKAIGNMIDSGTKISLVDINKSEIGFSPDCENNTIRFGLKGLLNVGDNVIEDTIKNRPYISIKDYLNKVNPNKQAVISLLKGGAFDNLIDRKLGMGWYIWETCDKKSRLTLQNMPSLIKYNLIPNDKEKIQARRIYEFNRYLKAICKKDFDTINYYLDERAINFLTELGLDDLIQNNNNSFILNMKAWDKKYQKEMDVFRNWINEDKNNILQSLNEIIFMEDWNKYALGTISAWEMKALCFYYHEHELSHINNNKYGLVDFNKLSENPVVDKVYRKGGKEINIFKLFRICGTCIAKDKNKATISLLTPTGVVQVKFRKEYFSLFDKRISEKQLDGKKKIIENSWFDRGNLLIIQGMRSGDDFIAKKYNSQGANVHQLYKITEIKENGDLRITSERAKGVQEEDND